MITVKGFLEVNGVHYKDPELVLVPHLMYEGKTSMDVHVRVEGEQKTTIGYQTIEKEIFDGVEGNAYDTMIEALENYVIEDLENKNPDCEFTT